MKSVESTDLFTKMMSTIKDMHPSNWNEIAGILSDIKKIPVIQSLHSSDFLLRIRRGITFWTFDFGIDGVSIEISKYAHCLQEFLSNETEVPVHFIAGDFHPQADSVIHPGWKRYRIPGVNGWSKWDNGKWFDKLFYQEMRENSRESDEVAAAIWSQAVILTENLGRYLTENNLSLLIPVNVSSNPGNIATALCTVLVSELLGIHVLNSNHDFYWEGGKPASEKKQGEAPGPRDKFFRNMNHSSFSSLFKVLYPWNGRRWIQVNINQPQCRTLIEKHGFSKNRVFQISTSVSDAFFKSYSREEAESVRLRMAHILSDGNAIIHPVEIKKHLSDLKNWMKRQKPVVCAGRDGLELDLTSGEIIYFLQPTRVIDRKRIERDVDLINALLQYPAFKDEFDKNMERQIVLHITGPTPIEHQKDLETILRVFDELCSKYSDSISSRLFLAFSVGNEEHECFHVKNFQRLTIEDIYNLATAVLFPSETEGRGLPIIEASSAGIPIICSRYQPEEIFADVVGEHLPDQQQIRTIPFPEGDFAESFLEEVMDIVLSPEKGQKRMEHNKKAAHLRYSIDLMKQTFQKLLLELSNS